MHSHDTNGRGDRPRHEHRGPGGPRKTGCDNEISLVSRLIAGGATITISSTIHDHPIEGVVIWSDLNNICIRAGRVVRVFAKRHIADWSFDATSLDG